jgi:hypothetical protein
MPTQEELKGMADHVIYEIDQFRHATNKVSELQTKRQKNEAILKDEWNIALESMLPTSASSGTSFRKNQSRN